MVVDDEFMKKAGFGKEVERKQLGLCPFCAESINLEDFRDGLSRKEFGISGLCQKCQDKTFGPQSEPEA